MNFLGCFGWFVRRLRLLSQSRTVRNRVVRNREFKSAIRIAMVSACSPSFGIVELFTEIAEGLANDLPEVSTFVSFRIELSTFVLR